MATSSARVGDWDSTTPTLKLKYTCDENELDLKAIYAEIHSLLEHSGRARLLGSFGQGKITPCSDAFLNILWSTAASLLDYFADFYATDTSLMQSIWFHLLDMWQTASPLRLYRDIVAYTHSNDASGVADAQCFLKDYKDMIELIHRLIFSKAHAQPDNHGESIIHSLTGEVEGLIAKYTTGPYISGLKPWQQFLYDGAPGFKLATAEGNDMHTAGIDKGSTARYVSQPVIGLIQAHTTRARNLAAKFAASSEDVDATELLAKFDANALALPTKEHETYTYPSLPHQGKSISYQLRRGAPPVKRYEGMGDPSMMDEKPDSVLLDEAVGMCKGRDAYLPVAEPVGEDGVGFDVWAVTENSNRLGWQHEGECNDRSVFADGLNDMFDGWHYEDDDL